MKTSKLFILLFLFGLSAFGQNNDVKSKAYYFSAKESFENNQYKDALKLLDKSEKIGGASNAYIESLKAQCYVKTKQWIRAKEALDACYKFNPNNNILKEISSIIIKIDDQYELAKKREQQRIKNAKEKEKQLILKRRKAEKTKLKKLQKDEILNQDYNKALNNYSKEALSSFLKKHPNSKYTSSINKYLNYLNKKRVAVHFSEKYRKRNSSYYKHPHDLKFFKNVEDLNLNYYKSDGNEKDFIKSLDDLGKNYFSNLNELTITLDLSSSHLHKVYKIKQLEKLTISKMSSLTRLDFLGIENLTKLKQIHFRAKVVEIPNVIGELKNLESFKINRSTFNKLPNSFNQLTNLYTFHLNNSSKSNTLLNPISSLKIRILTLGLSGNPIEQLAPVWNLNLWQLSIYNESMSTVSNKIENLKGLGSLELGPNIQNLPESFSKLENLYRLDIEFDKNMKSLPKEIMNLKKLKYLYINDSWGKRKDNNTYSNYISSSIKNLSELKELKIGNQIKNLPSAINNLNNLELLLITQDTYNRNIRLCKRLVSKGVMVKVYKIW